MSKITMDEVAKEWLRLAPQKTERPSAADGWRSTKELMTMWGIAHSTCFRRLSTMRKNGIVENIFTNPRDGHFWRIVKKVKK